MVIQRLFSGLPEGSLTLVSRTDYADSAAGFTGPPRLRGDYRHLRSVPRGRFRIPLPPTARAMLDAIREIRSRALQVGRLLHSERADVLVACSGDLYDLPAAELACRRTGIPFIAWMFDDYLFQWTGPASSVARRFEPRVVRAAAALVVPNSAARDAYLARYGVRATVIGNPCERSDLVALDAAPMRFPPGESSIVYAGSVYHAQLDAFRNLLEAIRMLGRPGVKLHIFTSQSPDDLARGGVSGPEVVHHAHIPPGEVSGILRKADILFLPLAFRSAIPEVIRTSAPGKMGEYLSVGRPVLVHAPEDAFVSRYFRENGCGAVVDRDDPAALATELRRLLDGDGTIALEAAALAAAARDFGISEMRVRLRAVIESVRRPR